MPVVINVPRGQGAWEEQDVNLFASYPFFIAANQAQRIQNYQIWDKLTGEIPWQKNMGLTVKGVSVEPSPISRQFPFPQPIGSMPLKDVISQRERVETETIYRHNFESPLIRFLPSFKDWRANQMDPAVKDINEQIVVYPDQFYRRKIWEKSPVVYVCGKEGELTESPTGEMNSAMTATGSKNIGWLQATLPTVASDEKGTLSLRQVYRAFQVFSSDIDAPPFEGAANMPKDGMGIPGKYCLVASTDATAFWIDDPYLKDFKPQDLDTPHDGFYGDLFGHIRIKYERWPLRFYVGPNSSITVPAPQVYVADPNAYNYGETVPNPEYLNAQYEVAWLCGAQAYRTIRVGAPPAEFASGKMSAKKFNSLDWNGKARIIDNVLVQALDSAGNVVLDTNKYGEVLQIIADAVMGILPLNRRYIMPIIFRRARVQA